SVPAGWTGVAPASLPLAPGATGTATLTVTSPASAVNGSYGITATATNSAAATYRATASATYVVLNPVCARFHPTVSLSPGVSPATISGGDAVFTITVTNNDTGACSASSFDLAGWMPAGWASNFSTPSLALPAGGSGTAALTVTSPFGTPDGTYPIS